MTRSPRRLVGHSMLWAVAAATLAIGGCRDTTEAQVDDEPFVLEDVDAETRAADFVLEVDTTSAALDGEERQPLASPVTVTGESDVLSVSAYVKRPPARSDGVWIDIMVENRTSEALRDVVVGYTFSGGELYDVTNDPFSDAPADPELPLGGIGPDGLGRVSVFVPAPDSTLELQLRVEGTPTNRVARNSSPIAITPDGAEVWATFPDADTVAVIDAQTHERLAQIEAEGGPSSIAVTPDGELVLVASQDGNAISVIDRDAREVVQTLDEEAGVPRDLRHLVIASDGTHAYASSYVDDVVVRLTRLGDRYEVDGQVDVGRRPLGLSVAPDGDTLVVSHFLPRGPIRTNEAWLSVIDTEALSVRDEVIIGDQFNKGNARCIADIFGVSPQRMEMEGVATTLTGVFFDPSGVRGWVPGLRVTPTPVLELGEEHADLGSFTNGPKGRFAPAFMFLLDAHLGDEVDTMGPSAMLDIPNVNVDYVQCADAHNDMEFAFDEPLSDTELLNPGLANPNAFSGLSEQGRMDFVTFSRGGRRALALSSLSDELVVYDATTLHPASVRHLLLSGSNPVGMVVSPDGTQAFVSYRNSTFVSVLDLSAYADPLPEVRHVPFRFAELEDRGMSNSAFTTRWLVRDVSGVPEYPQIEETGQVAIVDEDPMDPLMRRGKILFESSNPQRHPEMSSSRQASCATCHPDGGSDGSGWATVEGERRTMSLRGGTAGRGWLHASASHPDATDFATIVVEERLGGSPTAESVEALSQYVAYGIESLQPPRVDEDLVARGSELFEQHCRSCHIDDTYGSGRPVEGSPLGGGDDSGPVLFDIGTQTDSAGILFASFFESIFPTEQSQMLRLMRGDRDLGPDDPLVELLDFEPRPSRAAGEFKAPSLVGVWDQAVFFHDGRTDTLEDAVKIIDEQVGTGLSEDDVAALVEFLKTL